MNKPLWNWIDTARQLGFRIRRNLKRSLKTPELNEESFQFNVETLEPRQMLSSVTGFEGTAVSTSVSLSDSTPATEYQILVDLGDGSSSYTINDFTVEPDGLGGSIVNAPNVELLYSDDGVYSPSFTLLEAGVEQDSVTYEASISNVAPTVELSGESSEIESGAEYSISFYAHDPGDDTVDSWLVDWGDGSTQEISGALNSATHVYVDEGNFAITVQATDEDDTYDAVGITLDSTFGEGGKVTTDFFGKEDTASSTVVQADGKVLVAGTVWADEFALGDEDSWTFDGSDTSTSSGLRTTKFGDQYIPIDSDSTYRIAATAWSGDGQGGSVDPASKSYVGFAAYDADQQFISPEMVVKYNGATDTHIAVDLVPGATQIVVNDATGWYNGTSGSIKYLAWYGYTTSADQKTHEDFTYTRNLLSDAWSNIEGNVITLKTPWAGPTLEAGTAVRNTREYGGYNYVLAHNKSFDESPTDLSILIGGHRNSLHANGFRPGTEFIRSVVLPNWNQSNSTNQFNVSDFSIQEVREAGLNEFGLARYNTDGTLDQSFGLGGKVATDFSKVGASADAGLAMTLQADGKIIVAGRAIVAGQSHNFAVARYNVDGSLDTTFGDGDGMADTNTGGANQDVAQAVTMQGDKILVSGRVYDYSKSVKSWDFGLARYNSDGTLDTTFGNGGVITTDFASGTDFANSVATQADGSILVSGRAYVADNGQTNIGIARYTANGQLDLDFGPDGSGMVITSEEGVRPDESFSILVKDDDTFYLSGYSYPLVGAIDFVLVEYSADGILNNNYGTNGIARISFDGGSALGVEAAIQADGKVVVSGYLIRTVSGVGGTTILAAARFNADGTADSTFGVNGTARAHFEGNASRGNSVAITPDGGFVVAGHHMSANNESDFAVAKFLPANMLNVTAAPAIEFTNVEDVYIEAGDTLAQPVQFTYTGGNLEDVTVITTENTPDGVEVLPGEAAGTVVIQWAVPLESGEHWITLEAFDSTDSVVSDQVTFRVVVIGTRVNLLEGEPGQFSTTLEDTSFGENFQVQIDLGDGSDPFYHDDFTTQDNGLLGTTVCANNIPLLYADDGDYYVTVTLIADGYVSDTDLTKAEVANVAPVVEVTGPSGEYISGALYTIEFSATDIGDDTISGWSVDWGDGIVEQVDALDNSASHIFIHDGTYNVTVSALDEDGTHTPTAVTLTSWFGDFGRVTDENAGDQVITDSTVLADGSVLVVGYTDNSETDQQPFLTRYNYDGSIDETFGESGVATIALADGSQTKINSVVEAGGGQLLLAAEYTLEGTSSFALIRLNWDGTIDETFGDVADSGVAGLVTTQVSEGWDAAVDLAIRGDKIFVTGSASTNAFGNTDFAIARYNLDGSLDTTFGDLVSDEGEERTGFFTTAISGDPADDDSADAITVFTDGSFLVAGTVTSGSGTQFGIAKYTIDGELDVEFGTAGLISGGSLVAGSSIAIVGNDDESFALVGTESNGSSGTDVAVYQFAVDGSLDLSFGNAGKAVVDSSGDSVADDTGLGIAIQADGKVVVSGQATTDGQSDFLTARLNVDGTLDSSFGVGGQLSVAMGREAKATNVAITGEGGILLVGTTTDATDNRNVALAKAVGQNGVTIRSDMDPDAMFALPTPVAVNLAEAIANAENYQAGIWRPDSTTGDRVWQQDGQSHSPITSWSSYEIDQSIKEVDLGDAGDGIDVSDDATGQGYILYSEESLAPRFGLTGTGSDHLVAVQYDGIQWNYNDGTGWVAFTPELSDSETPDLLVASLDFDADTAATLEGQQFEVGGISAGYIGGDIAITPNSYGGSADLGEFEVSGQYVWTGDHSELGNGTADGSPTNSQTVDSQSQSDGGDLHFVKDTTVNRSVAANGLGGIAEYVETSTFTAIVWTESGGTLTFDSADDFNPVFYDRYMTTTTNHVFIYTPASYTAPLAVVTTTYDISINLHWEGSSSSSYTNVYGATTSSSVDYETNGSANFSGLFRVYAGQSNKPDGTVAETYTGNGTGVATVSLSSLNAYDSIYTDDHWTVTSDSNDDYNFSSYDHYTINTSGTGIDSNSDGYGTDEAPEGWANPSDGSGGSDDAIDPIILESYADGSGVISGNVWDDVNGDGIQDADEVGVAGVSVYLWADENGDGDPDALAGLAVTDAAGDYVFSGLESNVYIVSVDTQLGGALTVAGLDSDVDQESGSSSAITLGVGSVVVVNAGAVASPDDSGFSNYGGFGSWGDAQASNHSDGSGASDYDPGSDFQPSWNVSWNTFNMSTFGFYSMSDGGGFNSNYVYNETDPITGNIYSLSGGSTGSVGATDAGVHYSLFTAASNGDGGENSSFMSYATSAGNSGINTQSHSEGSVTAESKGKFAKVSFSSDVDLSLTDATSNTSTMMLQNSTGDSNPDGNLLGVIDSSSKQVDYEMILTTDSSYDSQYVQSTVKPEEDEQPPADPPGDDSNSEGESDDSSSDGVGGGDGETGADGGGGDGTSGDSGGEGSESGSDGEGGSEEAGTDDAPPPEFIDNQEAVAILLAMETTNQAQLAAESGEHAQAPADAGEAEKPPGFQSQVVSYVLSSGATHSEYQAGNAGAGGSNFKLMFLPDGGGSLDLSGNSTISSQSFSTVNSSVDTYSTSDKYLDNDGSFVSTHNSYSGSSDGNGLNESDFSLSVSVPTEDADAIVSGASSGSSQFAIASASGTTVDQTTIGGKHYKSGENNDYDNTAWFETTTFTETTTPTGSSSSSYDSSFAPGVSDFSSESDGSSGATISGGGSVYSFVQQQTRTTTLPETDGASGGDSGDTGGSTGGSSDGGIAGGDAGSGDGDSTGSTDAGAPDSEDELTVDSGLVSKVETTDLLYTTNSPVSSNGSLSSSWNSSFAGRFTDSDLFTSGGTDPTGTNPNADPDAPVYSATEGTKTSTSSGGMDMDSSSSYGLNTNDPSFSLQYASTSDANYENGGYVIEWLDYSLASNNKAPSSDVSVSDNRTSEFKYLEDGVQSTTDGGLTITRVESAEEVNPTAIVSGKAIDNGEGSTFTVVSTIDPQDYKVTYDNTVTSTATYEDFGSITSWQEPEPESSDGADDSSDPALDPPLMPVTIGTGVLTSTVNALGGESYKRKVTTVETETSPKGGGGRTDIVDINFKQAADPTEDSEGSEGSEAPKLQGNNWNLTDELVVTYLSSAQTIQPGETGNSSDSPVDLEKGAATVAHTISGTRNKGGTVNTSGSHGYGWDYLREGAYDIQFASSQSGSYTSKGNIGTVGTRSGTITGTYNAQGDLFSVGGSQEAEIKGSGAGNASATDFNTVRLDNLTNGNSEDLTETRTTTLHDDFTSTLSTTRTPTAVEGDNGKLTYDSSDVSTFTNNVTGHLTVEEDQVYTHTDQDGPTSRTDNPVNSLSYSESIGADGFYTDNYSSVGYRGNPTDADRIFVEGDMGLPGDDGGTGDSNSSGDSYNSGGGTGTGEGGDDTDNTPASSSRTNNMMPISSPALPPPPEPTANSIDLFEVLYPESIPLWRAFKGGDEDLGHARGRVIIGNHWWFSADSSYGKPGTHTDDNGQKYSGWVIYIDENAAEKNGPMWVQQQIQEQLALMETDGLDRSVFIADPGEFSEWYDKNRGKQYTAKVKKAVEFLESAQVGAEMVVSLTGAGEIVITIKDVGTSESIGGAGVAIILSPLPGASGFWKKAFGFVADSKPVSKVLAKTDSGWVARTRAITGYRPMVAKWARNSDGLIRSQDEIAKLLKKHGVDVPNDVTFRVGKAKHYPLTLDDLFAGKGGLTAKFGNLSEDAPGGHVYFKDLISPNTGKIHIEINPNMMGSDEAILAVMVHELYELEMFRGLFEENGGSLLYDTFKDEAMDGIPYNFHWNAWEIADDFIRKLRGQ